ncbi:MAG: hypothetical protein ACWA42_00675 [Lutibacter sp.]
MKFKNLSRRKKPNYIRGIILVLLLFLVVYLWMHAEEIVNNFFSTKN